MKSHWIRKTLLVSILAGVCLAVACGTKPDGKYQDSSGEITLTLNSGKASMNFGGIQMEGTYTVNGNKLTIAPTVGDTRQTIVFTINSDGSLDAPPGAQMPKLLKSK